ncbi:MAG: matrixin family metalloprotease [Janthinobacterium lividum]
MTEFAFEAGKRSSTAISWSFENQNFANDFFTPFSGSLSTMYQSVVVAAFARWSSVSGLTFNQVLDLPSVPIRIGFGSFAQFGELGETDYRSFLGVLSNDTLIRLLDPANSPLLYDEGQLTYVQYGVTLYQVVLHEIGHALGLAHTTDPGTLMYPYASSSNQDLAAGDIQGINTLYPLYTVSLANPAQAEGTTGQTTAYTYVVTRYSDPSIALTIGYSVTPAVYPAVTGSVGAVASEFSGQAFPRGVLTFAPGSYIATLTVNVAGNTLAQPDQGFRLNLTSFNPLDSVTVNGKVNGAILDDDGYGQLNGTSLGVYRFFGIADGTHFYSTSETERNTLIQTRADLVYEGIGLKALAFPSTDPAAAPVFRFFDVRNGTHFYSASASERDTILATRPDLSFEGTAFYEHTAAKPGDTPVYRFFDLTDGTHFYTSSATERATILTTRADLRDEGIGFYAPT